MRLYIEKNQSPAQWIEQLLQSVLEESQNLVAYFLVGASLEKRHVNYPIPYNPDTHEFVMGKTVYHVMALPNNRSVHRCAELLEEHKSPVLLVCKSQQDKALASVPNGELNTKLSIFSIENFFTLTVTKISSSKKATLFSVLQEIVQTYNKRLAEVETDLSLQIEVR